MKFPRLRVLLQGSGIAMILAWVEFRYSRTTRWSERCRDCSHDHFWDLRNSYLLRLRNLSTMKFKTSDVSILVILRYLGTHGLSFLKFQISKIGREIEGDVEILKQNLLRFNNLSRGIESILFLNTRGNLSLLDLIINLKRSSKTYDENINENIDKNIARRQSTCRSRLSPDSKAHLHCVTGLFSATATLYVLESWHALHVVIPRLSTLGRLADFYFSTSPFYPSRVHSFLLVHPSSFASWLLALLSFSFFFFSLLHFND